MNMNINKRKRKRNEYESVQEDEPSPKKQRLEQVQLFRRKAKKKITKTLGMLVNDITNMYEEQLREKEKKIGDLEFQILDEGWNYEEQLDVKDEEIQRLKEELESLKDVALAPPELKRQTCADPIPTIDLTSYPSPPPSPQSSVFSFTDISPPPSPKSTQQSIPSWWKNRKRYKSYSSHSFTTCGDNGGITQKGYPCERTRWLCSNGRCHQH